MPPNTDDGRDTVTPIVSGPVDTRNIASMELFKLERGKNISGSGGHHPQDLVTFTVQIPKDPETPQGRLLGVKLCIAQSRYKLYLVS